ncbi:MAG: hypothetical protein IH984_16145 [Planctomycetes bacterium]|nr:hypothetical protein [Planctomycetota bacterium]
MKHAPPPLLLPRGLILAAAAWLIFSWLLSVGLKPPVEASSASYTPGVRLMLVYITIGLMIGWPLLRLSQAPRYWPLSQTILDMVVLLSLIQVVIWPLRLITYWALDRTAALDATMAAWTLLTGAIIASAIGTNRFGVRNLAILGCIVMSLLGPAIALLIASASNSASSIVQFGPIVSVYKLASEGGNSRVTSQQWIVILIPTMAAILAWSILGIITFIRANKKRSPIGRG